MKDINLMNKYKIAIMALKVIYTFDPRADEILSFDDAIDTLVEINEIAKCCLIELEKEWPLTVRGKRGS